MTGRNDRQWMANSCMDGSRQCGNVLVLLAVYHSDRLRSLIHGYVLRDLVERTLEFVRGVAHGSPALRNMLRVVEFTSAVVLELE